MKRLMLVMTVVGLFGASAFAGDPGGVPGVTSAGVFSVRTYGGASWFASGDGTIRSGAIGDSQSTTLEIAFTLDQNATLSFSSYASSESSYDYLRFYLNDQQKSQKSGTDNGWASETCRVSAGSYVIRWVYSKDSSSSSGSDAGFLRDVKLTTESGAVLGEILVNGPKIISSQIRANDPTILDVVYKVVCGKPTVNVRALAFEDGERSFFKVVRPETFVKDADGNATAQNIGDNIAANVEHKLSWKVSADWKTDLAKVKFEVLTSEMAQLPLKTVTIPAVAGKSSSLTVAVNDQTDANIFNALLWHYADAATDLEIRDGYL